MNEENRMEIKVTNNDPIENAKTYTIWTIQDMVNSLTSDRIDGFMKDFEIGLRSIVMANDIARAVSEQNLIAHPMIWTDDHKPTTTP